MGLSIEQIEGLLAAGDIRKRNRRNNMYCIGGTVYFGKPSTEMVGGFQGKAGNIRRSTKGRVYRVPNGSRKYIGDNYVSWYKVKP